MELNGLKYLIVGAGPWGSVMAERIAESLGERVLVIDRRPHPAGNCYSTAEATTGIECHEYGTHIFHTKIPRVWEYVNRFDRFSSYRHRVFTEHRGRVYPMPISLATINAFYGLNLKPFEVEPFIEAERAKAGLANPPANLEEKAVALIGRPLYEAFIKGYTAKQWEKDPRELPADIIARLPVRLNYNNDYFSDPWQGLPLAGYTALFTRIVAHPRVELRLNVEYRDIAARVPADCRVLYSGPVDEYFGFKHGRLEWRSLRFERQTLECADYQGTAVMNQADIETPFTRTHEYKHLHPERACFSAPGTVIEREYPRTFRPGDEPYYPVNTPENQTRLELYRREAAGVPGLLLGGRLGTYRYLDMDQCIESALSDFAILANFKGPQAS